MKVKRPSLSIPAIIENFRNLLALVLLAVFCGWLALIAFWFVPKITAEQLDPMMTLVAGLGIGGVTNALLVLITLVVQFYFRRAQVGEGTTNGLPVEPVAPPEPVAPTEPVVPPP